MKIRFKKQLWILIAAIHLITVKQGSPLFAKEKELEWQHHIPHSGQSIFERLEGNNFIEITLVAELDSLVLVRNTDDYRNATFSFTDKTGLRHNYRIKIKPRGKFRRKVCDFPPLKLKFSKQELEAAGLAKYDELKLVTHCLDDKNLGQELVLREHLVYRMFNELSPNSFRVQLVKINYRDVNRPDVKMTRWGFILEDDDEFANRRNLVECDTMGQTPDRMNIAQERLVSLFQYMVGNHDWDVRMLRNVKLMRGSDQKLIPVPYDFDFSALVSAPYARLNTDVGQKSLRQRVFMGQATSARELYSTFSYFKSRKNAILDLIANYRYLSRETREAMIEYVESFYQIIESEENAQKVMFPKVEETVR